MADFGDVVASGEVEDAARATLQAWLPSHLDHQRRRRSLPAGGVPRPRSWPTVSEFDPEPHEQLPSVVLVSPGTTDVMQAGAEGDVSATWRLEIVAGVAGRDEPQARLLAGIYAAAIRSALIQNGSLGIGARTRWTGEDYAVGATNRGPRALAQVSFTVEVDDVVNVGAGPAVPPPDPTAPPSDDPTASSATVTIEPE